jgi:hypothetical protein
MTGVVGPDCFPTYQTCPFVAMGFRFREPQEVYDASGYTGITFWAKNTSAVTVYVLFPTYETLPLSEGGGSTLTCGPWLHCGNHFMKMLSFDSTWRQYTVDFSSLSQEAGWGEMVTFNPAHLFGVYWRITNGGYDFDLSVDDIQFVGGSTTPEPTNPFTPIVVSTPTSTALSPGRRRAR